MKGNASASVKATRKRKVYTTRYGIYLDDRKRQEEVLVGSKVNRSAAWALVRKLNKRVMAEHPGKRPHEVPLYFAARLTNEECHDNRI